MESDCCDDGDASTADLSGFGRINFYLQLASDFSTVNALSSGKVDSGRARSMVTISFRFGAFGCGSFGAFCRVYLPLVTNISSCSLR